MWSWIKVCSLIFILTSCTYKPVVDHRGSENDAPKRYDDDLATCRKIAKENSNEAFEAGKKTYNWLFRPRILWLSPKAEDRYKKLVKTCLEKRGHNVLD